METTNSNGSEMNMDILPDKDITFGILLLNLGYNQIFQLNGSRELAKKLGVNLIVFPGQILNSPEKFYAQENIIYDFIDKEKLNGLIIWSGGLNWYISDDQMYDFFNKFKPLPIISLETAYKGISSIVMDDYQGMKDAVNHLIEKHHHKKIAFLSGMDGHKGARERRRGYIDALKEHNLPVIDELISPSGRIWDNIESLRILEERKAEFSACAMANNHNILYIYNILRSKNIRIPEDLAIAAFDNDPITRVLPSPLTIVNPPFYKMGWMAVELLYDQINGKPIPELESIKPELIIRHSCGCSSPFFMNSIIHTNSFAAVFHKNIYEILDVFTKESIGPAINLINIDEKDSVYDAFKSQLINKTDDFHILLKKLLDKTIDAEGDPNGWQDVLSAIRLKSLYDEEVQKENPVDIENIFHQNRVLISEIALRNMEYKQIQDSQLNTLVNSINRNLMISYNIDAIMEVAAEGFPGLNISSCFINIYVNPEKPEELSRLIMAYNENGKLNIENNGVIFPTKKIVPDGYLLKDRIQHLIVLDLYFQEEQIGFIVFGEGAKDYTIYDTIRSALSSSLMGALLVQQITEHSEQLKELDIMKNDFIANITHDFRSPLTVILNTSDIAVRYVDNITEETREKFNIIYKSSLRLKNTIDKLLDLAKLDAKGLELNIEKTQLTTCLNTIADYYASAVMTSGIKIIKKLPDYEIVDFYTDVEKLEEILDNILSNAIKFIDPNTGVITLELIEQDQDVIISISDNGLGIQKDKLEIIFKRFEQAHEGRTSEYKGTGIGLAFSKKLAEYLKGEIWAESDGEGKGSRFFIKMKKGENHFNEQEINKNSIQRSRKKDMKTLIEAELEDKMVQDNIITIFSDLNTESEGDYKKGVILVIDDDKHIREIIIHYLSNAGLKNFIIAGDGKQGLEAVYEYGPDIIICDYNMPNMKGDEMHNRLAGNPKHREIPFIFLSAVANESLMTERREIGAAAYLKKPIEEKMLIITVDEQLRKYYEMKAVRLLATLDELTGLNNRRSVMEQLRRELSIRKYRDISILFFDVDNFKGINDEYGHQAGDIILSGIGKIILKTIRKYDIGGRYGGDEFIIILPETTLINAVYVGEIIRKEIAGQKINYQGKEIILSSSFGVSSLKDNAGQIEKEIGIEKLADIYDIKNMTNTDWIGIEKQKEKVSEILLELADKALYLAKKTVCRKCGFSSEKKSAFAEDKCPECGSVTLDLGRNKVVGYRE